MNIVHLIAVKNSFYILESGRTIRKSAHFSLILGTKNLVKIGTQQGERANCIRNWGAEEASNLSRMKSGST